MSSIKEESMHSDQKIKGLVALIVTMCAMVPVSALAQDAPGEEKQDQELEGPLKDQLEEYWSVDRELPMIRERLYEFDGRFMAGVHAGIIPSEPFYVYVPLGARVAYFFSNELGVEVSGSYLLGLPTQLNNFLGDQRQEGFDASVDTEDQFIWNAEAVVTWHPLYGKWALLQRKLSHLDFSFVAGAGAIGLTRPDETRTDSVSSVAPALVFGAGLGFFVAKNSLLRLDWRSRPYLGPKFTTAQFAEQTTFDRLQVPTEFTLGFSYLF